MTKKHIASIVVSVFAAASLLMPSIAAAEEERGWNAYKKDNSVLLKAGKLYNTRSDYAKFWGTENDATDVAVEYSAKMGKDGFFDLTLGQQSSTDSSASILIKDDSFASDIRSNYLTMGYTQRIALKEWWFLYAGAGVDVYMTDFNLSYKSSQLESSHDRRKTSFGGHALISTEFILNDDPVRDDQFNAPYGIFIEYSYAWIPVAKIDKTIIDDVNAKYGTSYNAHDHDLGGQKIMAGVRWHF